MTDTKIPAKTLWQASIGALLIGLLVLFIAVLPAEYNIDPTGLGTRLGLTVLAPSQAKQANVTKKSPIIGSHKSAAGSMVQLALAPSQGLEYKLTMQAGDQVTYEWLTDGAELYVDVHGEPADDTSGYFKSYTIATAAEMSGSFIAPFTGSHGWYFRNDSDAEVQIQLFYDGDYSDPRIL